MIGKKTEQVLNRAVRVAIDNEHEYFTLEHVLLALLDEEKVQETLEACGGDLVVMKRELVEFLNRETPKASKSPEGKVEHPVAAISIQRLIQRAWIHVQASGKDEIQPIDLFVAIFHAKESHSLYLLLKQNIDRLDVVNFISHGIKKDGDSGSEGPDVGPDTGDDSAGGVGAGAKEGGDPLALYTTCLNDLAREGKVDALVGRQSELERMIQTLCRRRKNNPILVGEAGVGKTALAEGLALRIVEGQVPSLLKDAMIYSLDLGSVLAGAKFRGDFEQRLKRVVSALEKKIDRGFQPILFIDEIHTLIGAGAAGGGVLDAANLLKPMLTRGAIRVIGSTTFQEFRNVFEKDHALVRRFQKIDVVEPTVEEAIQILSGLKSVFEKHHGVTYTPEAIRLAVELSAKHITDRFLPDKAIDVIDEVGAKMRLKASTDPSIGESSGNASVSMIIDGAAIEEGIAQIARIPARSVSTGQKYRLKNLERDLKLTIFGQDPAVESIVTAIRLARSGLRSGDKPMGSFLFCGPTGVGKTELSKQLASCLGVPFLRFDMSEYSERHTISRLIGAPPGYVGFEQAGLLTDAILKNPHSVVLLDEIEKAHSEIWNILLQVMDHGFLTDNNGRKADFRNAILLMTSNVGSRDLERRPVGMGVDLASGAVNSAAAKKAIEVTFSPEFRNRLDAIVYFNPLHPDTIVQVVSKQLMELEAQLIAKHVEIEIDADARAWLAEKGYDRWMGARPLARLIQDQIKKPLAEEILFGRLENGGRVHVRLGVDEAALKVDGHPVKKLVFEIEAASGGTSGGSSGGSSSGPSSSYTPSGSPNSSAPAVPETVF